MVFLPKNEKTTKETFYISAKWHITKALQELMTAEGQLPMCCGEVARTYLLDAARAIEDRMDELGFENTKARDVG